MRVFISADIEGTAFATVWDETHKGEIDYVPAARQMTMEVKAACEGAIAAGADYILIKDAHGTARNIDPNELHIVLAHEPQYLDEEYVLSSPDLIITGHAHGGQVRLPFIGGLVAPDQGFLPEYTAGEYKSGDTAMYVSRGLGNSVIPLRVFNYPEINVLIIKAKN